MGAAAFPLFLVPVIGLRLEEKFDWSRVDTSSLTSIAFIGGALGVPVIGWLNDRWSVKLPVVLSMAAVGLMLLLASIAPPDILVWQAGIFLLMFLGAGTLSASFSKIICSHFDAMRGLALGITIGSVSMVTALALPWFNSLIDHVGTSRFFLGAGLVYFAVMVPLMVWLLPASRLDGQRAATAGAQPDAEVSQPYALWLLGLAGILLASTAGSAAHLAGVAADGGSVAPATVGSVFALGVLVSRPAAGFVIDHVNARLIGALMAAMAAAGLLLVGLFGDRYVILGALLLAACVGAEFDIVAFLASKYVSPSRFGRIFGWMYSGMLVAAAAAPVLIAVQLGAFGSYRIPLLLAALVALMAAGIMLVLPPYVRNWREE
ncbi:MAG: MFS transporter [Hyphomonas sp.]